MNLLRYLSIIFRIRLKQIFGTGKAIVQNQITRYPKSVISLENNFAVFTGVRYALTFCNATSAIEAALYASGIGKGDEVIVPSCTFHSSIDPIINAGATPVFADVDPLSFTMDMNDVKNRITNRTRAIIVVHLFGTPADMNQLISITSGKNIKIIEDVSHAHGAIYHGKICGSIGDFGVFSLQGDKAIAGGEGGIVVTNDRNSWIKMSMWGHFDRHAELFGEIDCLEFRWTGVGYKRRMAPLSAVIAAADLDYLAQKNKLFRNNTEMLDSALSGLDGITVSRAYPDSTKGGLFSGYPISLHKGENAAGRAVEALKKSGITAYPWPYASHHKLAIYSDPDYRHLVKIGNKPKISADNQTWYPVLPVTEDLNASAILLSKKYTCLLDKNTLSKIKNILKSL